MRLEHKFVEQIPEQLDEGVLYVSMQFGTAVHKCACGCGQEVVTPLGPAEWRLTYDGRSVSLAPSIGNWSFECRSHYWIERGHVRWAKGFSDDAVAMVRRKARTRREGYYTGGKLEPAVAAGDEASGVAKEKRGVWRSIFGKFPGRGRRRERG